MDIEYTEEKKNEVIAQRGRSYYARHMKARVLRRTLPAEDNTRKQGERAERQALDSLISIIETVDRTSGSKPT